MAGKRGCFGCRSCLTTIIILLIVILAVGFFAGNHVLATNVGKGGKVADMGIDSWFALGQLSAETKKKDPLLTANDAQKEDYISEDNSYSGFIQVAEAFDNKISNLPNWVDKDTLTPITSGTKKITGGEIVSLLNNLGSKNPFVGNNSLAFNPYSMTIEQTVEGKANIKMVYKLSSSFLKDKLKANFWVNMMSGWFLGDTIYFTHIAEYVSNGTQLTVTDGTQKIYVEGVSNNKESIVLYNIKVHTGQQEMEKDFANTTVLMINKLGNIGFEKQALRTVLTINA